MLGRKMPLHKQKYRQGYFKNNIPLLYVNVGDTVKFVGKAVSYKCISEGSDYIILKSNYSGKVYKVSGKALLQRANVF